jgi:hypothetical protein
VVSLERGLMTGPDYPRLIKPDGVDRDRWRDA